MSTTESPGAAIDTSSIGPGEKKLFTYLGELIPNQVFVQNESSTEQANFVMQGMNGAEPEWKLYGVLRAGETVDYMVQWPAQAIFTNQGLLQTSIRVYGNGIFPGEQARDS